MSTTQLIAGLAWDPEIRGFLAVLTGVIVLMGSVWLLLATNSGARLATLLSLAGFFGCMFILGVVWWMYGNNGWVGAAPSWVEVDITVGDLSEAPLEELTRLPNRSEQPSAYELAIASDDPVALAEFGPVSGDTLTPDQTEGLSDAEIEDLVAAEQAKNEATTLSELAAVSPQAIAAAEDAGLLELGGWKLLSTAEAGEAQASAIAFVLESSALEFTEQREFKILDTYTIGGKAERDGDGAWDRVVHRIKSTIQVTHPTRYGVVQLQAVTDDSLLLTPGQPPPRAVIDSDEPVVSVLMVRDLGDRRLRPALVTIGSLTIFLALCLMLHERDKELMARRAAFEAER